MNVRSELNTEQRIAPVPESKALPEDHEVRCGMCAGSVDVDEETYRFVSEAIESGLDNPFRCEICQAEYDDLAYEG